MQVGLLKLRLAMAGTLAFIIGISTLFFTGLMLFFGVSLLFMPILVIFINIIQWLVSPYLINALYRVRMIRRQDNPGLFAIVEKLAARTKVRMPQIGIADIPIPNAFAYSSPFTGPRVTVTRELLDRLEDEEVEAVLGHELGHLRHRDVQVMMFASVLPAIFYFVGYSLLLSGMFSGGRRNGNGGSAVPVIIGGVSLAIYFILTLFVLYLSRLREYYADRNSVSVVDDGPRKLSEALAKIVASTEQFKRRDRGNQLSSLNSFRSLFIADPSTAASDAKGASRISRWGGKSDQQLVQEIATRKLTTFDKVMELFSTHPNIVKRIRTLQNIQYRIEQ